MGKWRQKISFDFTFNFLSKMSLQLHITDGYLIAKECRILITKMQHLLWKIIELSLWKVITVSMFENVNNCLKSRAGALVLGCGWGTKFIIIWSQDCGYYLKFICVYATINIWRAVVVTQLVERLIPTPEICSSNPEHQ